jgi:glucose/mannose-6-phosphate isomerase
MLSLPEIKSVDRSGLYKIYRNWYNYCEDASKIDVISPDVKRAEKIVFAGMGGSAIVGDILKDWFELTLKIPFQVVKDYHLPNYADKHTFVIAVSCSGNTEETISIVYESIKKGCMIATVSSGGILEKISIKNRIPHNKIKLILVPRASFPYLLYVPLRILSQSLSLKLGHQIKNSINTIKNLSNRLHAGIVIEKNQSKKIASRVYNTIPITYCSPLTRSVGIRFKSSLNENAKVHTMIDQLPELCHNEIVTWEGHNKFPIKPIFLRYKGENPEVMVRFEVIKDIIKNKGVDILELFTEGNDHLSKVMSLLYILEFSTLYLAVLQKIDPVPTLNIDKLKFELEQRLNYLKKIDLK